MNRELQTVKCPQCKGRGQVPDTTVGEVLKLEREEAGVNRTELLTHFGYSDSYTFDLERGSRPLTWELVDKYRSAIGKAVQERLQAEEEEVHAGSNT